MFYVNLPLGNNSHIKNNTIHTPECTYAIVAEEETAHELRALLPIAEGYDSVYALMASANPKTQLALLKLWHERLGHANFTKFASILGLSAPSPPPACLTCMAAKSNENEGPLRALQRSTRAFARDMPGLGTM